MDANAVRARALSRELKARFDDPDWRKTTLAGAKAAGARKSLALNRRNLKTLYGAGMKIGFGADRGAVPKRIAGVAEHRESALWSKPASRRCKR
ncbi:MAG: hypothetical protein ACYDCL_20205 [Myxococcales bacterium]